MNKLFGLFFLAVAFLVPNAAFSANCFWVGGTASWDGTNTGGGGSGGIKWASGTGGSSPCAGGGTGGSPSTGDTATFDANSGGGTVTVNTTVAIQSITAGAFTGTLDFNTNNNNVTVSATGQAVNFSGTGTRTINIGSGTWTLSGGGNWELPTTTNLTGTFSNAAIVMNGAIASRSFSGGGQTYGSLTIGSNSSQGSTGFTGANTFASITCASGNLLMFPQGTTTTISGALTLTGTSSAPAGLISNALTTNITTISVGSASSIDWAGIGGVTRTGAGTLTATNSLNMGRNTSFTSITPPSGGGGGGGRIIGG